MGVPFPALKTMVTVVLLLMGNASQVVLSSDSTRVKLAAYEAVTKGISLDGVTLQDLVAPDYTVTCAFEVENWTRFPLMLPRLRIKNSGAATTSPTIIPPGKREAFAVQKPNSNEGVYGTISWEIEGVRQRVVIMWSAPINFSKYTNWMGLGTTRAGIVDEPSDESWYDQMYYQQSNADLKFLRLQYDTNTDPFIYSDGKFEVEGVMTNGHNAKVKVVVRPITNNKEDLARVILQRLD